MVLALEFWTPPFHFLTNALANLLVFLAKRIVTPQLGLQRRLASKGAPKTPQGVPEGIVGRYFGKAFWDGILGRYFGKVFWEGILGRYFGQVFCQAILGRYFGKVFCAGIWEGVLDRYFGEVFWAGILGRYFGQVFWASI